MKMLAKRRRIAALAIALVALLAVTATQLVSAGTPSEDSVVGQAMSALAAKGVSVESWSVAGSTLAVTLTSASTTAVGTPDDQISLALVQREAFLAKSRGVALSTLQLTMNNATGKNLFSAILPLDKELDAAWSVAPAKTEADAATAFQAALTAAGDFPGLAVDKTEAATDAGARQLSLAVTTADVKSANLSTAAFMLDVKNSVDKLNATQGAQIALTRVAITDASGAPLLNWLYDAQRGTQDWWQAPGMTTDWFEAPPAGESPAATEAAID